MIRTNGCMSEAQRAVHRDAEVMRKFTGPRGIGAAGHLASNSTLGIHSRSLRRTLLATMGLDESLAEFRKSPKIRK